MEVFDILLDSDQELQANSAGDFKTGDCANNYIKYIVLAAPGHYKMTPNLGASIYSYVNANSSPAQIERAIRSQLENDVFNSPKVDTTQFPIIKIDKVQLNLISGV